MDERVDFVALREAASQKRDNHYFKKLLIDDTATVRMTRTVEMGVLEQGKTLVMSEFLIRFWTYADKSMRYFRALDRVDGNKELETRFRNWLEEKAVPLAERLARKVRVQNQEELIALIMITTDRIQTLHKIERRDDTQLPGVLIESLRLLEGRLTAAGLMEATRRNDRLTVKLASIEEGLFVLVSAPAQGGKRQDISGWNRIMNQLNSEGGLKLDWQEFSVH